MSAEKKIPSSDEYELPEYGFDTFSGQLLVGQGAIDAHIEAGGHPADIRNLKDLLLSEELDATPKEVEYHLPLDGMTKEEYADYGRWVLKVLGDDHSLKLIILERARKLGIGPSDRAVYRKDMFGNLQTFYDEIGAESAKAYGLFCDWSVEDFALYLRNLGNQLGRKPSISDIDDAARANRHSPSRLAITRNAGISLPELYEMAGFTDVRSWTDDDYVHWGVRFMFANNGMLPTKTIFNFFSKNGMGPSDRTIIVKFGINNYKSRISEAYLAYKRNAEQLSDQLFIEARKAAETDTKDKVLEKILSDELDKEETVLRYAKYLVAKDLLGQNNNEAKVGAIIGTSAIAIQRGFAAAIQNINISISIADVEVSAMSLGVFDIIWPPKYDQLKLSDDVLAISRPEQIPEHNDV